MWLVQKKLRSTKFSLTLEKRYAFKNKIKTLIVNDEVVKEQTEINKNLYYFYQNLFSKNNDISRQKVCNIYKIKTFWNRMTINVLFAKRMLTEEEVKDWLNKINKSHRNHHLKKKFMTLFGIPLKF